MTMLRTVFRTCTLCEAMCGLKLEIDGDRIVSVRGDEDDPFSQGYICPKGVAIGDVHHDPDRLRTPLIRAGDGSFAPIGWDSVFLPSAQKGARTPSPSIWVIPLFTITGCSCCGRASPAQLAHAIALGPARRTRAPAGLYPTFSTAPRSSCPCPISTERSISFASAPIPGSRTAA